LHLFLFIFSFFLLLCVSRCSNWSFPQPVALGSLSGLVNKTTETGLVRGSVASADPVWHAVPVSPVRWTAWRRAGRVGSALGGGVAVGA
jgi:hypothetical protein